MVAGRAHYVWGKQKDFPYGERWISGPFDDPFEAATECERVRALYPEANLSVRIRTGALPECKPRRGALSFDLSRVAERRAAAAAIAEQVRAHGLHATIEDWDGEPDVDASVPFLSAAIWVGNTPAAPMPFISWHGARYPLRALPGVWTARDVNTSHRRKATSSPRDWPQLLDMLVDGLLAAIDGSAFDLDDDGLEPITCGGRF